jgi:hypothetical protein
MGVRASQGPGCRECSLGPLKTEQALENQVLKEVQSMNLVTHAARPAGARHLQAQFSVSEWRACRLVWGPMLERAKRTKSVPGRLRTTPVWVAMVTCPVAPGRMASEPQASVSNSRGRSCGNARATAQRDTSAYLLVPNVHRKHWLCTTSFFTSPSAELLFD